MTFLDVLRLVYSSFLSGLSVLWSLILWFLLVFVVLFAFFAPVFFFVWIIKQFI